MKLISDIHDFFLFLADLVKNRNLIFELARQDFKQRFASNILGVIWAFVNPLIQVSILWFVFSLGFRAQPVEDIPYIYWLLAGFFPWLHLSELILYGTNSIVEKPYLVKKIVFRVSTLPIIKIISISFIHLFFISFLSLLFVWINAGDNHIYKIQIIYFIFCTMVFSLAIIWITSAVVVFVRDMSQIVAISIQFGFWITPIFWSQKILPEKYQFIISLNPAAYIVQGYRDSLIGSVWFFERQFETVFFWGITSVLLIFGMILFRRMRTHFADVM